MALMRKKDGSFIRASRAVCRSAAHNARVGRENFKQLCKRAEEGLSLEDAAAHTGIKVDSAKLNLFRYTGSTCWPPKTENKSDQTP